VNGFALEVFRLQYGNALAMGQLFDRALLQFLAAPGGAIRLGKHCHNLMTVIQHGL